MHDVLQVFGLQCEQLMVHVRFLWQAFQAVRHVLKQSQGTVGVLFHMLYCQTHGMWIVSGSMRTACTPACYPNQEQEYWVFHGFVFAKFKQ